MLRRRAQPEADASASANTQAVQQDWKDRDFLTSVQLGLSQLSAFLNEFGAPPIHTGPALDYFFSMGDGALTSAARAPADAATRSKLSTLDGKLSRLERRMQVVDATLQSVDQGA